MIAPAPAPYAAPAPVGVSQDVRNDAESATTARAAKACLFIGSFDLVKDRMSHVRRTQTKPDSKKLQQLSRDTPGLFQFAQAVFLGENLKIVRLYALEQTPINRGHDFSGNHRATIFSRKKFGGLPEEAVRACRFEFHQAEEALIVNMRLKIRFGVPETRHIFLREVNAPAFQVAPDIADDVRHLQSEAKLDRVLFGHGIAIA